VPYRIRIHDGRRHGVMDGHVGTITIAAIDIAIAIAIVRVWVKVGDRDRVMIKVIIVILAKTTGKRNTVRINHCEQIRGMSC